MMHGGMMETAPGGGGMKETAQGHSYGAWWDDRDRARTQWDEGDRAGVQQHCAVG